MLKIVKMSGDISREVLKFVKFSSQRLGVLDMVVESCSFYEVFLKVVFKKAVNYNVNKSIFVIPREKEKQGSN